MVRALENKEQVDAFVIYTDSETYMGKIHPQAALEEYRRATGIDAKLIVVGMTSNCLTIADPKAKMTAITGGKPDEPYSGRASTTATFDEPGDYMLHVTANDYSGNGGGGGTLGVGQEPAQDVVIAAEIFGTTHGEPPSIKTKSFLALKTYSLKRRNLKRLRQVAH